ncbi:MAG: glycosyltransferase family 4 protein [Limisphaerales bacterium]
MRVGVFHPGTQHSWQTALAFQEAGMLAWHATSVFYDPNRWPYKIERCVPSAAGARLNREFRRRCLPALDLTRVRHFGAWEWSETLLRRLGRERLAGLCNRKGNRAFGKQVIRLIEREPVDLLWGYDTASLEVFQWARKRGILCVLDQTIGHPILENRIMLQEQERHSEFFLSSYRPFDREWIDRQNAEIAEANLVLVGSEACGRTLLDQGCPREKVRTVPYGYDDSLFPEPAPARPATTGSAVDFLFVGQVGPRKGIAYLLQAFANVPADRARLTLVGRLVIPPATFRRFANRVRHVHQVPRSEVGRYFMAADCFVFPSLFEGSALALCEACGAGLGIIQSERSGNGACPGQNGVILPEVTVPALTKAVQRVTENTDLLRQWREASWAGRGERTWAKYRRRVVELALHN